MSAGAVGKAAGDVARSVVGDVRYIVVTAIGIGVGTWLGRYWWMRFERGLLKPPYVGKYPGPPAPAESPLLPAAVVPSVARPLPPPPPGKSVVGAVSAPEAPTLWAGRPAAEES
jgi:hypothetical protein